MSCNKSLGFTIDTHYVEHVEVKSIWRRRELFFVFLSHALSEPRFLKNYVIVLKGQELQDIIIVLLGLLQTRQFASGLLSSR